MSEWTIEDVATLRDMAVAGGNCEEIAHALKRRQSDVRDMASLLGISLDSVAKLEWCDRCCNPRTHLDPKTGWCSICTKRIRIEAQRIADEEEERRHLEEVAREQNVVKTQRKRMRELYGANPRKSRR